MRVKLTKAQRIRVLNSVDVYEVMQRILLRENKIDRNKEHFWVVCLSNSNKILLIELVSLGTMKKSLVDPTEVFSFALQKRAAQLIMVHNHPGGSLQPSPEDTDITDRMYQVGLFLDLPVIDHLIITERKFYSFKDSGLLAELSKSEKYVLKYKKEEQRIRKEGEKKGLLKKAVEMARALKKKGIDMKVIAEVSKLSIKQIEKM
ncbi:MAG: JAB domain-containing protein [Nitrospirota bacterium]